ncbi:hypothetical protein NC652_008176 [Populus alba x Populus x berolinensis]|nr:hypothetical protein NC652_008176 [Populus alba x Populus x berolinensis]
MMMGLLKLNGRKGSWFELLEILLGIQVKCHVVSWQEIVRFFHVLTTPKRVVPINSSY